MNEIIKSISVFENIKHIDEFGSEYWSARELSKVLEYSEYRKFMSVIKKAMVSCNTSLQNVNYHFAQSDGMIDLGKGAKRKVSNYKLSRYACYLIVQMQIAKRKLLRLVKHTLLFRQENRN